MNNIPFQTIDWTKISKIEHKGETGTAYSQTIEYDKLRIRIVEFSKGYVADHWCQKGHIVFCLEGAFKMELKNGTVAILKKNMSFIVSDDLSSHRALSENGVKLLVIDGEFLMPK